MLKSRNLPYATKEDLTEMLNEIRTSGRLEKRREMQEKSFTWNISLDEADGISDIRIEDFRYLRYKTTYKCLNTLSKKSLPAEITVRYKNAGQRAGLRLYLYLDKERLYRTVESLTSGNEEMPLEFSINVQNSVNGEMKILLKAQDQTVAFTSLEVNIVR